MKPIAVIDAYQYGSASQGHLILNGIFTASHFSISSRFIERTKGDEKTFLKILKLPLSKNPNYPLERINVIDRLIMQMSISEMLFMKEYKIPYRVTISSAIENAKKFSSKDSTAFVNGVLDSIYKTL
jgi:N utilization substance protein B